MKELVLLGVCEKTWEMHCLDFWDCNVVEPDSLNSLSCHTRTSVKFSHAMCNQQTNPAALGFWFPSWMELNVASTR